MRLENNKHDLAPERGIDTTFISDCLRAAVVSHVLKTNRCIYVNESGWFPHWISVHMEAGCVNFHSHTNFSRHAADWERLVLVNELNKNADLAACYVDGWKIYFQYVMPIFDGEMANQIVKICRQFSTDIKDALRCADPNGDLILPPGCRR